MLIPMLFAHTYFFRLTLALFLHKTSISMSINAAINANSNIIIDAFTPNINPILVQVDTVASIEQITIQKQKLY